MKEITSESTLAIWDFFKANPNEEFTAPDVASRLGILSHHVHAAVIAIIKQDPRLHFTKEIGHRYKFMYIAPVPKPKPEPDPQPSTLPLPLFSAMLAATIKQNELLDKLIAMM